MKTRKITTEQIETVYNFLVELRAKCYNGGDFQLQEFMKEMKITNFYIGTVLLKNEIVKNTAKRYNPKYRWNSKFPDRAMAKECLKRARALAKARRKSLEIKKENQAFKIENEVKKEAESIKDLDTQESLEFQEAHYFDALRCQKNYYEEPLKNKSKEKGVYESDLTKIDKMIEWDLKSRIIKESEPKKEYYVLKLLWGLVKIRITKH